MFAEANTFRTGAFRRLMELSALALGVHRFDLRDYFRLPVAKPKRHWPNFWAGTLVPYPYRTGSIGPTSTATQNSHARPEARLVSPFDPLVWERARAERLFNFTIALKSIRPLSAIRLLCSALPDGRPLPVVFA
jgi:uncharacterized protein YcaQ